MKVTNCYIERTFNLGNYESLKIGFEANVCESDKPLEVAEQLESLAHQHYENSLQKKKQPLKQESKIVYANPPQSPAPKIPEPNKSAMQLANEATARREVAAKNPAPSIPQDQICPQCGGKKQPQYPVCYNCHMKEMEGA